MLSQSCSLSLLSSVLGLRAAWGRNMSGTYSCALPLKYVAEVLEVRVPPAHDRVTELESWDVRARVNLVGGVHGSRRRAMGLRILDLQV